VAIVTDVAFLALEALVTLVILDTGDTRDTSYFIDIWHTSDTCYTSDLCLFIPIYYQSNEIGIFENEKNEATRFFVH